jgi:hypothetical protein
MRIAEAGQVDWRRGVSSSGEEHQAIATRFVVCT